MLGRDSISAVVESLSLQSKTWGFEGIANHFIRVILVASIQHNNCSAFEKQQNNDVGWP